MDTAVDVTKSRRKLLTLLALSPLAALAPTLAFAAGATDASDVAAGTRAAPASRFLALSRVLTDSDRLTQGVADRIEAVLRQRDAHFDASLDSLEKAFSASPVRAQAVETLSGNDLRFALEIAKPWYLGYVGEPSNSILKDDAAFVTFLEAQSYEKVLKDVPRQSYPPGSAGWWGAVPDGVTPPPMPQAVTDWRFRPDATPGTIVDPSPDWLAYAQGQYADVDAARSARPKAL